MASTILRFRNPTVFQILDRRAYRAVYGKRLWMNRSATPDQRVDRYFEYIDRLVELSRYRGLNFRTVDRLLYIFDKEKNKKL